MKKEIKDLLDAFEHENEDVLEETKLCARSMMDFSDLDDESASKCSFNIAEKIFSSLPDKVSLKFIIVVLSTTCGVVIDSFLEEHHDGAEGDEYVAFGKLVSAEIFCKLLRSNIRHLISKSNNE